MESPILPNETTIDREELAALRRDANRYRGLRAPVAVKTIVDPALSLFVIRHSHAVGCIPEQTILSGDDLDDFADRWYKLRNS